MSVGSRCIINFGRDGREKYSVGQARLNSSLDALDDDTDRIFRVDYPIGCPETTEVSHVFKLHMFREAFKQGYDYVLWLDASAIVRKDLEYIWREIQATGHFFVNNPGCLQATWASEDQLEAMGSDVEEASKYSMCRSGIVGMSIGMMPVLDEMLRIAEVNGGIAYNGGTKSSSPYFKEARHDQVVFSHMIHRLRLYKFPSMMAQYTGEGDIRQAFVEFRGIS
jgi:hypothetical protein